MVWTEIRSLLRGESDLAPDDPALLIMVLSSPASADDWRAGIDALLATGKLRRLIVGRQPHLALCPQRPVTLAAVSSPKGAESSAPPDAPAEAKDEAFDLEIAIDVERERLLLYRVFAVFGGVGLALLVREFLLLWADS